MQYRRIKRPLDGVLLLDKPAGISSNQALQQAKHLYQAAKAGHTGSLDPFATGLLPLCFGEATKFSHFLLEADKTYVATMQLGATTTTGDIEGEILSQREVKLSHARLEAALESFLGEIRQVPPMHSALKHEGKPLYEYARAGIEIPREARAVRIDAIDLLQLQGSQATLRVSCSKGTYIRALAEDIGRVLGCGAHLIELRREVTGGFEVDAAVTLDQLEAMTPSQRDACLLPPDCLLLALPAISLDVESATYLLQGQAVWKSGVKTRGLVRLYQAPEQFLGLGEIESDGKVAPRRLLNRAQSR